MAATPNVVAIVVARTGSTRVPGKALIDLCGHPIIWHVLQAARRISGVHEVCLATSDAAGDDCLKEIADNEGIKCFRGDAERVLDRVYGAAAMMEADIILEIGGDCPLLDAQIVSDALDNYLDDPCDYLCNYEPPTFPEGMDVNIVSMSALTRAWREAVAPSQRIHPFSYLTYHPELFVIRNYAMAPDLSQHHWSLDFPEDVELVRRAYLRLWQAGKSIHLGDVLRLLETDNRFNEMDRKLQRPKVSHAFWNSPGILRDMHDDLAALAKMAYESQKRGDFATARHEYSELMRIAGRLHLETTTQLEAHSS